MATTTDVDRYVEWIRKDSPTLVGHNLYGYDLLALERHHGLRIEETLGRIRDIHLQGWLADPPTSRETSPGPGFKSYSLDALAGRVLGREKDARGRELVKEFGSWDAIPIDDPRYHAYCQDDAQLALDIHRALPWTPYMEREMRVQAIMSRMTLNGFRVDTVLLQRRIDEGERRKEECLYVLQNEYGIPAGAKSPLATKAGKEALVTALREAGAPHYPRTATGQIQASREGMDKMASHYAHLPGVVRICNLVKAVTSERTIYSTIAKHLHGDRVHPDIWPRQASGRWSVTNPGMTVVGKRGALSVEREVFLPEEGGSIIAVDLGQADMRVVAAHAQDPEYMKLFGPGRDVHSEIATAVFGSPDNGNRFRAKAIGHGAGYGRGAKAISEANPDIPFDVAQQFIDSLRENYPKVAEWQSRIREQGEAGMILDNGFGRPMRVEPDRAYTQSPAQVGQGGTRDLMAEGLLTLASRAPELLPMLRAVVHDEVVLSVPTAHAEEIGRVVVSCMEREWAPEGCSIPVHITADCTGPGANWAAAYKA